MIKFAPFIEYKMDECYLTNIECVGIITTQMALWDNDNSSEVLNALFEVHWSHRFDKRLNRTEYCFGGKEDEPYTFSAIFRFTADREYVQMLIYRGPSEDEEVVLNHVFDDDEAMDFIDFLTYKDDPKRLEDCDDWKVDNNVCLL